MYGYLMFAQFPFLEQLHIYWTIELISMYVSKVSCNIFVFEFSCFFLLILKVSSLILKASVILDIFLYFWNLAPYQLLTVLLERHQMTKFYRYLNREIIKLTIFLKKKSEFHSHWRSPSENLMKWLVRLGCIR